ncbi:peptidylprolyl isomerase [Neisseriaceae bacterium TC5R-5]|nr:peptidylprolyl isomerase [Neisseriaceae bacterium TC5R-5]
MRKLILSGALMTAFAANAVVSAATVNGQAISDARIKAITTQLEAQSKKPIDDKTLSAIKDQMITVEVLRQEALKKGLDKSPEFIAEMANMQATALANRLISDFQQANPVSEADLKAEYNKAIAEIPERNEFRARHILVKTEAEANAILSSLKKGASFDKLAKEKSLDPGSKANGGDLGWQESSTFVAPFSDAMTKLSKGEVTAKPVKTDFGWHIIKLEDKRTERPIPSLEEVKPQLTQRLQGAKIQKFIESLKAKADIKP